jgi:hypothetical protein
VAYTEDKKPEPTYTVQVRVIEVTPETRTGAGVSAVTTPRQTEDIVNVTVRGVNDTDAIDKAISQLQTAREGL